MAEQEYLSLSVFFAKQFDEFNRVVAVAIDGERRRERFGIVERIGAPRAMLVPLHDGEKVFPRTLERPPERHLDGARTTMDVDQDRVAAVGTAHVNDLSRTAQYSLEGLLHATGSRDPIEISNVHATAIKSVGTNKRIISSFGPCNG